MKDQKQFIWREAVAGLTTFLTMSYIVVVNPAILAHPATGMNYNGVLTATVVLSFLMTLFMGLYAKLPFAVAPGMGINAFFTFSVVIGKQVPWQQALGAVFWAGVLFVIISVTPVREMIAKAIPKGLRIAAAVGIGLFLTFIGLKNSGLIVSDAVTYVKLGQMTAPVLLGFMGLFLIVWLMMLKQSVAFLASIVLVTIVALVAGLVKMPEQIFSLPDFTSVFLQLDLWGSLKLALVPTIISIMFTDLFDSISTFVGVSHACNMLEKNGEPKNLRQGLIVDAFATMGAGLLGTSSGTAFIESSAGIEAGGRTGLTSVFTALCFLPCLFIAPLAGMVPAYATAPVLVIVGALMFRSVTELKLSKLEDAVPSFLTIVMIPLTFSITQGILWGFIAHVVLYLMAGRRREIHPIMYCIAAVSALLIYVERGGV